MMEKVSVGEAVESHMTPGFRPYETFAGESVCRRDTGPQRQRAGLSGQGQGGS